MHQRDKEPGAPTLNGVLLVIDKGYHSNSRLKLNYVQYSPDFGMTLSSRQTIQINITDLTTLSLVLVNNEFHEKSLPVHFQLHMVCKFKSDKNEKALSYWKCVNSAKYNTKWMHIDLALPQCVQ